MFIVLVFVKCFVDIKKLYWGEEFEINRIIIFYLFEIFFGVFKMSLLFGL